jgi:hypothetical protein
VLALLPPSGPPFCPFPPIPPHNVCPHINHPSEHKAQGVPNPHGLTRFLMSDLGTVGYRACMPSHSRDANIGDAHVALLSLDALALSSII